MAQDFRLLNLTLMLQRMLSLKGAIEPARLDPNTLATAATERQRLNHAQALLYEVLKNLASKKEDVQLQGEFLLEHVLGMLWAWGLFTENGLTDMREHPGPE
jgi:hypothetical protein